MGLSVSVFSKLRKAEPQDAENVDFSTQFFAHPATVEDAERYFPGRSVGIEIGVVYDFGTMHDFSFGYGEFNDWRDELASMAGTLSRSDAFQELINFPDNEGVIGPVVSQKLAKDFADFEPQARTRNSSFVKSYLHWKHAFETAANSGAVQFQ